MRIIKKSQQQEAKDLLVNIGNALMGREGYLGEVLAMEYVCDLAFIIGDVKMMQDVYDILWPEGLLGVAKEKEDESGNK